MEHLNQKEIEEFKTKLQEELSEVEEHLETVARRNPDNPEDWEPKPDLDMDTGVGDKNEFADSIEDFEEHSAVTKRLEIRYNQIKKALERIEGGTYGYCLKGDGKHPIKKERLEANPSASTCLDHDPYKNKVRE